MDSAGKCKGGTLSKIILFLNKSMQLKGLHPSYSAFHSTARRALQALGQTAAPCGQEEATNFSRTRRGVSHARATRIPREGKIPLGLLRISEGWAGGREGTRWGDTTRPFH